MRHNLFYIIIGLLILIPCLSSCDANEDSKLNDTSGNLYSVIGTLLQDNARNYYILSDNDNNVYFPNNFSEYVLKDNHIKEGDRIFVEFINGRYIQNGTEISWTDVTNYKIDKVLIKEPIEVNSMSELERIGTDSISVLAIWMSKGFININFRVPSNGIDIPKVNLAIIEPAQIDNDNYLSAILCHDLNGIMPTIYYYGHISFKSDELLKRHPYIKGIKVIHKSDYWGKDSETSAKPDGSDGMM